MTQWDVVIVGAGPAGLSAALMLGRSKRKVLIVDSGLPRNRFANHMHGVLGYEGESPQTLLEKGRQEVADYGVEIESGEITEVRELTTPADEEESVDQLQVSLADGTVTTTRMLIVASGLNDRLLDIPGLAAHWGITVLHCPYCHGWEVRDKKLAVLGESVMNLHQAQLIRQLSDNVTLFTNGVDFIDDAARARLESRNIRIVSEPVAEVLGDGDQVTEIKLSNGKVIEVDAIFTGGMPEYRDEFLASLDLEREETPMGNVLKVDQLGKTSHPRIFAVGNVNAHHVNVPLAIGLGSFAGAGTNAALVTEEFDLAEASG